MHKVCKNKKEEMRMCGNCDDLFEKVIRGLGCSCGGDELPGDCPCEWRTEENTCDWNVASAAIELLRKTQKEVKKLRLENNKARKKLHIMYNRCISFIGSANCAMCKQRKDCESQRTMWRGYHLVNRRRVRKDGD